MAAGFVKALTSHAKQVQGLQDKEAKEFLSLLGELRERLIGRLSGDPSQTFDIYRARYVLAETEASIATLEEKLGQRYSAITSTAAKLSDSHLTDDLNRLSKAFDDKSLRISIDAQRVLANPMNQLLMEKFKSEAKGYGQSLINGVRREIFMGMQTGASQNEVIQRIAGKAGPFVQGKAKLETIARTETINAYGTAQIAQLKEIHKEEPSLKKVWVHLSSYDCDQCKNLHGSERDLTGDNSTWTVRLGKRDVTVSHAPLHPNCTCRTTGMKPSWRTKLKDLGYLDQKGEEAKPNKL